MIKLQDKKASLFFSITTLGISSMITQIVLMREFLVIFTGNELTFGVVLGAWFLLTGAGSYSGKYAQGLDEKHLLKMLCISQLVYGILPFFYIILMRCGINYVFMPGKLISPGEIVITTTIFLAPFCFTGGVLLTLAAILYPTTNDNASVGKIYFIDNIGDILGGILFSFIFIYLLSTFQTMYFIMAINFLSALWLNARVLKNRVLSLIICFFLISTFLFAIIPDMDKTTLKMLFPKESLLFYENSPYGQIAVTQNNNQLNVYENRVPIYSSSLVVDSEETAHYPLSQQKKIGQVLLVSGCLGDTLWEIEKHGPIQIDCLEIDPHVFKIKERLKGKPLFNEKINYIAHDARSYIKNTKKRYSTVILALPEPFSAQINRLYTDEFFRSVKKVLTPRGSISLGLNGDTNYLSNEAIALNSTIYRTLKNNYSNVLIIPGQKIFYIASNGMLHNGTGPKISRALKEKNIKTKYVNEAYLNGTLTHDRISYINNTIKGHSTGPLNTDLKPLSYYLQILHWLSFYKTNMTVFIFILVAMGTVLITRLSSATFTLFTTGFFASSLEVIIILYFQTTYGYVYSKVGLIVTAFMTGLCVGALMANKSKANRKTLLLLEVLMAVFCIITALIVYMFASLRIGQALGQSVFFILSVLSGMLGGYQFPVVSKHFFETKAKTASTLYFSDFIGAFYGAILVSTLLIPLIGIINVCFIVFALKILSGTIMFTQKA